MTVEHEDKRKRLEDQLEKDDRQPINILGGTIREHPKP